MLTIRKNHDRHVILGCSIALAMISGALSYTALHSVLKKSGHSAVETAQSERGDVKDAPRVLDSVATQAAQETSAGEANKETQRSAPYDSRSTGSTQADTSQSSAAPAVPTPEQTSPTPTNPETPPTTPVEPTPTEPTPPTNPEPPTEPAPADPPANP